MYFKKIEKIIPLMENKMKLIAELETENKLLKIDNSELLKRSENYESEVNELKLLIKNGKDLTTEIIKYKSENEILSNKLKDTSNNNNELKDKIKELTPKYNELLEKYNANDVEKGKTINLLNEQISYLKETNDSLTIKYNKIYSENQKNELEIKNKNTKIDILQQNLSEKYKTENVLQEIKKENDCLLSEKADIINNYEQKIFYLSEKLKSIRQDNEEVT